MSAVPEYSWLLFLLSVLIYSKPILGGSSGPPGSGTPDEDLENTPSSYEEFETEFRRFNITRIFKSGDTFTNTDPGCDPDSCSRRDPNSLAVSDTPCKCKCKEHTPIFLQHRVQCVQVIDVCEMMLEFHSPVTALRKAPTIFLPLHGQIINPSSPLNWKDAGITLDKMGHATCRVFQVGILLEQGWKNLEKGPLFSLINVNRNTFLQWLGNTADSDFLSGKLVQISVQCAEDQPPTLCAVFRVIGSDLMSIPSPKSSLRSPTENTETGLDFENGLSTESYALWVAVVFGCLLALTILGVVVFWWGCWKHQKHKLTRKIQMQILCQRNSADQNGTLPGPQLEETNMDQPDGGVMNPTNGPHQSATQMSITVPIPTSTNPQPSQNANGTNRNDFFDSLVLVQAQRAMQNLQSWNNMHRNFAMQETMQPPTGIFSQNPVFHNANIINPALYFGQSQVDFNTLRHMQNLQINTRMPMHQNDQTNAIIDQLPPPPPYPNQQVKKKLYFSPEFFDPQLMENPPPLAEEFLFEVRRMIDIAKNRIRLRKYNPCLSEIMEENTSHTGSLDERHISKADSDGSVGSSGDGDSDPNSDSFGSRHHSPDAVDSPGDSGVVSGNSDRSKDNGDPRKSSPTDFQPEAKVSSWLNRLPEDGTQDSDSPSPPRKPVRHSRLFRYFNARQGQAQAQKAAEVAAAHKDNCMNLNNNVTRLSLDEDEACIMKSVNGVPNSVPPPLPSSYPPQEDSSIMLGHNIPYDSTFNRRYNSNGHSNQNDWCLPSVHNNKFVSRSQILNAHNQPPHPPTSMASMCMNGHPGPPILTPLPPFLPPHSTAAAFFPVHGPYQGSNSRSLPRAFLRNLAMHGASAQVFPMETQISKDSSKMAFVNSLPRNALHNKKSGYHRPSLQAQTFDPSRPRSPGNSNPNFSIAVGKDRSCF